MRVTLCAFLLAALCACPAPEGDPATGPQPEPEPAVNNDPNNDVGVLPCGDLELILQCPPGSEPTVEAVSASSCQDGEALVDGEGEIEGLCVRVEGCVVRCNFEDPCACGILEVRRDAIVCAECELPPACGDALCAPGEDPTNCPIDCGERCEAGQERCNGDDREECEDTGLWALAACREDQTCEFGRKGDGVTLGTVCQARSSEGGGSFPGLGEVPGEVVGVASEIRFVGRNLPCPGQRFMDEGRKAAMICEGRVEVLDLESGARSRTDFAPPNISRAAWSSAGAVAPGRWPKVGAVLEGTSRSLDPIVHDLAAAREGAVAISDEGSLAAAAFSVGIDTATLKPLLGIWSPASGRVEGLMRFVDQDVVRSVEPSTALALSANGQVAAEARPGGLLILWNVQERRFIRLIQTNEVNIKLLVFSPRGPARLLVVSDLSASLWDIEAADVEAPERLWTLNRAATSAAFSPDMSAVVLSGGGPTSIVDLGDLSVARTLQGSGPVAFDPSGRRLIVGATIYTDSP